MASLNNLPSQAHFSDLSQLIHHLFEPMGSMGYTNFGKGGLNKMLNTNWIPNVDVKQEATYYLIQAVVPGVSTQDREVRVTNGNTLIIQGPNEMKTERKTANYVCLERAAGAFCRSVTLPGAVNASKIRAKVRNGVLEITAPKLGGKGSPRKIKIKTEK